MTAEWWERAACRASEDPDAFFAEDETWMDLALCAETDPEIFYPEKGGSTREAKAVCMACEVRAECLEYALGMESRPGAHGQHGVWGGLSAAERKPLVAARIQARGHAPDPECKNGHWRTKANTRVMTNGAIRCLVCEREQRFNSKEKAA